MIYENEQESGVGLPKLRERRKVLLNLEKKMGNPLESIEDNTRKHGRGFWKAI
jgi:hypothetical protein